MGDACQPFSGGMIAASGKHVDSSARLFPECQVPDGLLTDIRRLIRHALNNNE